MPTEDKYAKYGITEEEFEAFKERREVFASGGNALSAFVNSDYIEKGPQLLAAIIGEEGSQIFKNKLPNGTYSIDALDETGRGPLHYLFASPDLLKLAIDQGADINLASEQGETAVMKAAEYGFGPAVKYLADTGADLSVCDKGGKNIIHKLAEQFKERDKVGQLQSVEILREKKVLIPLLSQQDAQGQTPIDITIGRARGGNEASKELLKSLLNKAVEMNEEKLDDLIHNYPDSSNNSIEAENTRMKLMYMIKGITPQEIDEFEATIKASVGGGLNPLTVFAQNPKGADFLEVILAQEGHDILQNEKQYSLLDKILWVLYKLVGAEYSKQDVNALDQSGHASLHYLVKSTDMLKLAVENGADVNVRNANKETPVMIAAEYGCADSVEYLASKGANLHAQDAKGNNILHKLTATLNDMDTDRQLEVTSILERKGVLSALLKQKNSEGQTPMDTLRGREVDVDARLQDKFTRNGDWVKKEAVRSRGTMPGMLLQS
jgi:ankyrin repeat protein